MRLAGAGARKADPIWDVDYYIDLPHGNVGPAMRAEARAVGAGIPVSMVAGGSHFVGGAHGIALPACVSTPDMGMVWQLGTGNVWHALGNAYATFPMDLLPASVKCPTYVRATIWSFLARWVNPAAGMLQGFGICAANFGGVGVASRIYEADAPGFGAAVGCFVQNVNTMAWVTKRFSAIAGPVEQSNAIAWPRPLTDWTPVDLVVRGATASSRAVAELWLDGALVAGARYTWDLCPSLNVDNAGALDDGGYILYWSCSGAAHVGTLLQVAYPRFRQGRFLPNGIELQG